LGPNKTNHLKPQEKKKVTFWKNFLPRALGQLKFCNLPMNPEFGKKGEESPRYADNGGNNCSKFCCGDDCSLLLVDWGIDKCFGYAYLILVLGFIWCCSHTIVHTLRGEE